MKYLVLFVLMGGITAMADWPAFLAHMVTGPKARDLIGRAKRSGPELLSGVGRDFLPALQFGRQRKAIP
jgi:hypothetical protein